MILANTKLEKLIKPLIKENKVRELRHLINCAVNERLEYEDKYYALNDIQLSDLTKALISMGGYCD